MAQAPGSRADGRGLGTWLWEWTKSIVVALVVWFLLRTFLVEAFRIPSGSMENTLLVGDFLFVNKALYGAEVPVTGWRLPAFREPKRGEILVFDSVEEPIKVVKRLIGVPGDTLAMKDGVLFRDGKAVDEPWAQHVNRQWLAEPEQRDKMRAWQVPHLVGTRPEDYHPDLQNWGPIVVPADSFFMMGDNRDRSYDGRYWGFLPRKNVRGTPLVVYFSHRPSCESLAGEMGVAPDGSPPDCTTLALPFLDVRWRRLFTHPH